jgi:outer membrane protein assembly factor BamB
MERYPMSSRSAALVLAALPFLLASSCGEHSPTGIAAPLPDRWYQTQSGYGSARPAVVGDLVIFGTGNGQLLARDRKTGNVRWASRIADEQIAGSNIVVRNGVAVVAVAYHTAAVDAQSGAVLWSYAAPPDLLYPYNPAGTPGYVNHARLDADESAVYIPAWGASVSAVDIRTGQARWVWQTDPAATQRSGSMGVHVSGDTVFATVWHFLESNGNTTESWLVALDRATGRELWRVVLPHICGGTCIQFRPALWGNLVIVNTGDSHVFAVDRTTQQVVWHAVPDYPEPGDGSGSSASVEVYGDVVYSDGSNGYIYARRASDGTVLWRSRYDGALFDDMLVTERRIYGGSGGYLTILDRESGRRLRKLSQPHITDGLFASPAAYADGQVFITVYGAAWSFDEP